MQHSTIAPLTGLRIAAALIVFAFHVDLLYGTRLVTWGYVGVSLFFCLSGFVLTVNYAEDFRSVQPGQFVRYFIARIARVWPLHVAGLAAALVLFTAMGKPFTWRAAAINLLLLQTWFHDVGVSFNQPSWSLCDEMFFYFLFPFWCAIGLRWIGETRRRIVWWFGGLTAITVVAYPSLVIRIDRELGSYWLHYWLFLYPPTRLLEFLLGTLMGCLYLRSERRTPGALVYAALVWAAGTIAITHWFFDTPRSHTQGYFARMAMTVVVSPAFALLVYALSGARTSLPARILAHPWMVWLGERSFSFYIWHELVLWVWKSWIMPSAPSVPSLAVTIGVPLTVTILISSASYRFIEVPARAIVAQALRVRYPRPAPA